MSNGTVKSDIYKDAWHPMPEVGLVEIHPDELPSLSEQWYIRHELQTPLGMHTGCACHCKGVGGESRG